MNLRKTANNLQELLTKGGVAVEKISVHQKAFLLTIRLEDQTRIELNLNKILDEGLGKAIAEIIKSKKPIAKPTKIADKSDK